MTGEIQVRYLKISFHCLSGQGLEQVTLGGGGVTTLEGVPRGVWIWIWVMVWWFKGYSGSAEWTVGPDYLKGLFQP